jgi:hypothetical protein
MQRPLAAHTPDLSSALGATLKANVAAKFQALRNVLGSWNCYSGQRVGLANFTMRQTEVDMGFGRGVLFWLLGVPIPIIILLALFWHH